MISLLLERVQPPASNTPMMETLKVEAGLQSNVRLFIDRLKTESEAFKDFGQLVGSTDKNYGRGTVR